MISLDEVPITILIRMFQKMGPKILCRMRCTSKQMNDYIEEYRFRIASRSVYTPMILSIVLSKKGKTERFKVQNLQQHDIPVVRIGDPYLQLSAIAFSTIEIQCEGYDQGNYETSFLPLLRRLRLKCDCLEIWYSIQNDVDDVAHIGPILSCIRFANVDLARRDSRSEDLDKWPIHHCRQVSLRFEELSRPLTVFNHFEEVKLSFSEEDGHNHRKLFADFLKKLRDNPSAFGRLKIFTYINFEAIPEWLKCVAEIAGPSFWECKERIVHSFLKNQFFTMTTSSGFFYIVYRNCFIFDGDSTWFKNVSFNVHFAKNNDRQTLFDVFARYLLDETRKHRYVNGEGRRRGRGRGGISLGRGGISLGRGIGRNINFNKGSGRVPMFPIEKFMEAESDQKAFDSILEFLKEISPTCLCCNHEDEDHFYDDSD